MSRTPRLFLKVHWAVVTVEPMVSFTIAMPVRLLKKGTINLTNLLLIGFKVKFFHREHGDGSVHHPEF